MKKQILLIALVNIFPLTSLFAFTNILWRTDLAGKVNSCTRINEKLCIVCNQNFYYVDMLNGNIDHNLSVNSCIPSKYGIITYDYHSIQILDHKVSFNVKWTFTGSIGQSIKKPYISNCKLFFQIFEGNIADLYFIDMENNNTSASKNFSSYIPGSNYVLIDNNYLLAERGSNSCRNSSLIDLNENFKAIWSFSNSYPVIEINQDVIVRLTENYGEKNYFASLRSLTGTKLWEFEANSYIASENSKIYFGYNNETTSTYTLYCLNAKNGTTLWQYQTPGFINTTPILHKNNLYMGSNENKIYCFNAKTGQTKWTFNITGFPVAASDDCLFIDDNGKLSCMVINPVTVQHPFDTYAITSDNQISITVSDHTIASISENTITALKNGRITVTFQLMNLTHEMPVFCYHHTDTRELEPNNTKNTATFLNENTFLKADLFENDVDYYQISLSHSTVLDLAFLPFSNMTVVHMKVFDPFGNQMAWDESSHGNPLIMPLSLSKGMYYIHIQYSDASYIDHDTPSYILAYQCYQKPYDLRQMEYEPNNAPHVSDFLQNNTVKKGRIQSVSDIDFYGFHLNARSLYTIYFNPDGGDYKIVLYDDSDNVLNQRYAEGDETIAFESFNNQGNYYVKVEPVGKILPFSMYDIHIQSNEDIAQVSKLTHLSIQYQSLSLAVGESTLLTAFAHYANGTSEIIHTPEFKSLDETVVGMDSNYMTGKSKGVTSIVLVYKGLTSHIEITVEGENLKHHGNLILVAGGGNDTNDPLFDSTQYLSDRVYKVFLTRVFNDQSIYYINPVTGVHDIDGDGLQDQIVDNNTPSVSSLESTITQWAVDQFTDGPLYVVLIDHGSIDTFKLAQNEILNAGSFNDYLDLFQEKTNRNVIVFIEACQSGSFINDLQNDNRMIITCTDDHDAYIDASGRISFTQFFMDKVLMGNTLEQCFLTTKENLKAMGLPYSRMMPQMHCLSEKLLSKKVGGDFSISDASPVFVDQSPNQNISANTSGIFFATLKQIDSIEAVWATVVPPNYLIPISEKDFTAPNVHLPGFVLTDQDMDYTYEGEFSQFQYSGKYQITFYARNTSGFVSTSAQTIVTVSNGQRIDADNDHMPDVWEEAYGLNPELADDALDADGDGLNNLTEYQYLTHPNRKDTDGDLMPDGWEVNHALNPNTASDATIDADNDGVNNYQEFLDQTNPNDEHSFVARVTIKGQVMTNITGLETGIYGASIFLERHQTNHYHTKTNQQGAFTLDHVLSGAYTLHVSAPSFSDFQQDIHIASNHDLDMGHIILFAQSTQTIWDLTGDHIMDLKDLIKGLQLITTME